MYEKIEIWKRIGDNSIIRFQCLKRMSDSMFAVQNADYIYHPFSETAIKASDLQFAELFLENDPTERCDWFTSLDDAISHHEREFGTFSNT